MKKVWWYLICQLDFSVLAFIFSLFRHPFWVGLFVMSLWMYKKAMKEADRKGV